MNKDRLENTSEKMRCFFGILLDPSVLPSIQQYLSAFFAKEHGKEKSWRLINSQKWHITLLFLGDTDATAVETLKNGLPPLFKNVSHFHLTIQNAILFPNHHHPHVIALDVLPTSELTQLVTLLKNACEQFQIDFDNRFFRPHLTVARLKNYKKPLSLSQSNVLQSSIFSGSSIPKEDKIKTTDKIDNREKLGQESFNLTLAVEKFCLLQSEFYENSYKILKIFHLKT